MNAGKEACVAFWTELMDDESTTFEVQHVFTDGDWATVRWRFPFRANRRRIRSRREM